MRTDEQKLTELAASELDSVVESMDPMRAHASARRLYRLSLKDGSTCVGVVNEDVKENQAFVGFSQSFEKIGLSVPSILASDHRTAYIESDLGDQTLMDLLKSAGPQEQDRVLACYRQAIDQLLQFQAKGLGAIDKNLCFEGALFDGAAVSKDVDYFCEQYLRRVDLWNDGDDLSRDVGELVQVCGRFERGFFMHRDFQSRNIMISNQGLYVIDYQSGREGPLQYDLASLLFQSQAKLSVEVREELLNYYLERSRDYFEVDPDTFRELYIVFVLVRALQNLGAYGKLGLEQGKEYFKAAIPFSLRNCQYILDHWPKVLDCANLRAKLERAIDHDSSHL